MQTLEIVKTSSKNSDFRRVSELIGSVRCPIDKELVQGILYELISNAKRYGSSDVRVRLDDGERLKLAVENEGSFAGGAGEKKEALKKIYRNKEMENYGIYGIIVDVTAYGGRLTIETDGMRFAFGPEGVGFGRIGRDGLVRIEIVIGKGRET